MTTSSKIGDVPAAKGECLLLSEMCFGAGFSLWH